MMVQGLQRRFVKVVRSLLSWEVEHESGESGLDKQAEEAAAGQASISGSIKIGHLAALQGHLAARPGLDLLSYRGSLGESSLHWAYLYNQPAIAHFLMEKEPRLVRSFYNGAYFRGENALHVTIACKQGDEARLLLGLEPDLLYSRAEGIFFHRGAAAYYGEYPLSFAVSTNQADIVRMLVVEKGAWISAGDLHGNTAAHLAVHHDRYEMYELLEDLWNKGYGRPPQHVNMPLSAIRNAEGQTPLVYSSALGKADMFEKLLTRSREFDWRWGNLSSYIYPLDFVDDLAQLTAAKAIDDAKAKGIVQSPAEQATCWYRIFGPSAAYVVPPAPHFQPYENDRTVPRAALHGPFPTALEVAVRGGEEKHDGVIMSARVADLLRKKWEHFGERRFRWRIGSTLVYLLIFAAAAVMRTELVSAACAGGAAASEDTGADSDDVAALCSEQALFRLPSSCPANLWSQCVAASVGEILVLLGAIRKLLWMADRARMVGWRRFVASGGAGFVETILPTASCLLVLTGFGVDFFLGARSLGAALLSAGSVLGWLYFGAEALLGHEGTGSFVITIRRILSSDLMRFAVLAAVVILGFTQAFFLMGDSRGVSGFLAQMYELLVTMLSPSIEPDATLPYLRIIYVLLACTLMVNLLVALMGDTFNKITDQAEKKFRMERTRMLLAFEQDTAPRARVTLSDKERYWLAVHGRPYITAVETDDTVFPSNDDVAAAVRDLASLPTRDSQGAASSAGAGAGAESAEAAAADSDGALGARSGAGAMPALPSRLPPASPAAAAAAHDAVTAATAQAEAEAASFSSAASAAKPSQRGGRSAARRSTPAAAAAAASSASSSDGHGDHHDDGSAAPAADAPEASSSEGAASGSASGRRVRASSRSAAAAKGRARR